MIKNKPMILGPTAIEKDILELGAQAQVYMRTPEFSTRLEAIFTNLQYVFQTQNPVLMFTSSGRGMMDACVANFFDKNETSSGALTNIQEIGKLIYEHSIHKATHKPLFIVDTIIGRWVENLKQNFKTYHKFDFTKGYIDQAKEKYADNPNCHF